MGNEFFTVDQVAELLDLHPKTVRNFIREGRLKGKKVGKQWRIHGHDLSVFTGEAELPKEAEENRTAPREVSGKGYGRTGEKVQVSSVVDMYVDTQEAMRVANTLTAILNSKDPSDGPTRMDHIYFPDEGKAQFMLWGRPLYISKLLNIIYEITKD